MITAWKASAPAALPASAGSVNPNSAAAKVCTPAEAIVVSVPAGASLMEVTLNVMVLAD